MRVHVTILATLALELFAVAGGVQVQPTNLEWFCSPPAEFKDDFGAYKSPLIFEDGRRVKSAAEWAARRKEILQTWHRIMGPWPELLREPKLEYLERTNRENFVQHRVRVETSAGQ